MIKKALLALAIAGAVSTAQATVVVSENFDSVSALASKGWILSNLSTPTPISGWLQGNASVLTAQSGADNSFISSSYLNAPPGGTLSNWLVTPIFSTVYGAHVSFWVNAEDAGADFSDKIAYGFIDAAGEFSTAVLSQVITVTTGAWTQITAEIGNTPGSARFAIQYTGAADASDYLGVDSLTVDVPEPSSIAILAAGIMGLTAARRRKNKQA